MFLGLYAILQIHEIPALQDSQGLDVNLSGQYLN